MRTRLTLLTPVSLFIRVFAGCGITRAPWICVALVLLGAVSLQATTVSSWGRQVLPPPGEMKPLMNISAGQGFNLGLRPDGTVVAWGANNHRESTVPEGLRDVATIAAGSTHALALRRDGVVVGWGDNRSEQATPPAGLQDVIAIEAGHDHSLALRADRTVVAWGADSYGQSRVPRDLEDVVAISAGLFHNLALIRGGTVVAWGLNSDGQATVPEGLDDVVAIAAGGFHSLALRADGTLVAWGNNDFAQSSIPSDLGRVMRIEAGNDHSLALLEDRRVVAWGRNHYGQTSVPAGLPEGRRIAAGNHHSLMLTDNGSPVAWGNNNFGQSLNLEDLQDVVAVSAWENQTVALKKDGTVIWWGTNWASGFEPDPAQLTNVAAVAAGRAHGLALRSDGTVVGWGDNLYGQSTPPEDLTDVVAIAAGDFHSLALRDDGTVVAWGNDFQGQSTVPRGLNKIVAIAAGREHSIALNHGGMAFVWGNNFYQQREVPQALDDAVAITAGSHHNLALRENGTVIGWGSNVFGQTEVPRGLSDAVALRASRSHSLAIRENRTLFAWGGNHYEQATIPNRVGPVVDVALGSARTLVVSGELQPPRLLRPFESRLVPAGEDIFLLPLSVGSPPFRFQWMKDGRPLSGMNGPALALNNVTAADNGTYSLILANQRGNVSSRSFSIEVEDPAVRVSVSPRVAVLGERAVFTANARGTGPFHFQWHKDGEPIAIARESTLILEQVDEEHTGTYSVEVSDGRTATMSEEITFLIEPKIHTHPPETIAARIGERTAFRLAANGSPPLTVRWFRDGEPIAESQEQTLILENVRVEDSGVYSAIVSNPAGRATSNESTLKIVPHIVLQPESQVFSNFGGTAVFEIRATGTPPLAYHWYKDGTRLAETQTPRLVLNRVRPGDAGEYYAVVSNPVGRAESEPATLMVPPDITRHPHSQTVEAGEAVEMTVRALGGRPFEYQWLRDGEPIPEAHEPRLLLENVDGNDTARYSVVVSNPVGSVTSQAASLSISPSILQQPENVSARKGDSFALEVKADGSRPLFYQWIKDGTTLAQGDDPRFTFENVSGEESGFYMVIISNATGIAVSDTVEVAIE